jgi:hypothetical protein
MGIEWFEPDVFGEFGLASKEFDVHLSACRLSEI